MGTKRNNTGLFKKDNIIIGIKINLLTIVEELEPLGRSISRPNGFRQIRCKCDCGKLIELPYSRLKTGRTKSCGCLAKKLASERLVGNKIWLGRKHSQETKEKMRHYDNSLRELKTLIRESDNYRNWRKQIFERDNYTCIISGEKSSGNIEAHHLMSLTNLIKMYNITTVYEALDCDELWDINNGITLNKSIHTKFHTIYGFGNNTPEQFQEFKQNNYGK